MSTQITLPEADKEVGDPNPPGDMNSVIIALNAMSATFWVYPTGDESGDDDTANFAAAVTALGSASGALYVGAGTYYLNEETGPLATNQWIVCAPGVFVNWLGTGDCFRFVDTSTYDDRTTQGGGIIGRPIIDGTGDGEGSCGLHFGDILGCRFDVAVQNFASTDDIGIHPDNQNYWTEEAAGRAYLDNCTQFVVFDCGGEDTSTGSFDRGDFTFYINQFNVAYNGVTWQNGASQVGGRCRVLGNFETANSAPDSAVLVITGTVPAGHPGAGAYSGLSYCELDVNVEADEGHTYGPLTIDYGSASNFITGCSGNVSFGAGFLFQESNITSVADQFTFQGPVTGDTSLSHQTVSNRVTFNDDVSFFSPILLGEYGSWPPATPAGGGQFGADADANPRYLTPGGLDANLLSGTYLCTPTSYAPGSATTLSVTSQTIAAFSSANVNTGAFTAPPSGSVVVEVSCVAQLSAGGTKVVLALVEHGDATPVCNEMQWTDGAATTGRPVTWKFLVGSLTAGSAYTFDLAGCCPTSGSDSVEIIAYGATGDTPAVQAGGPVIMTVQAV